MSDLDCCINYIVLLDFITAFLLFIIGNNYYVNLLYINWKFILRN